MSIRKTRRPKPRPALAPAGSRVAFILAGQSNAEGHGIITFPYSFQRTETYFKSVYTTTPDDGAYQGLVFGTNNSTGTAESDNEAEPMIYLAETFEGLAIEQLRTIKVAIGGTGFLNGTGLWASGGALRNALRNHYVNPGLSKLTGEVWLMPFLWIQGESDAGTLANANAYESQLRAFFTDLRSSVGISDFPIVVIRLHSGTTYEFKTTIQAAQDSIAASDKNVWLINPDAFTLTGDNIHYTPEGFQQLAAAYLALARKIGSTKWPGDFSVEVSVAPSLSGTAETTATFSATIAEYGILHAGVYAAGSPNPGAAAIKAGTGTGYVANNSTALIYNASGSAIVSGLTAATNYQGFTLVEDVAGNQTAVGSFPILTAGGGGYGALTTAYDAAAITAGDTLSTAALNAVEAFFYNQYDNGAAGTGRVADFAAKFGYLWAPVGAFVSIRVPLIGANFTNVGFTSANWNVTVGLAGNGSSYFNSNYALPSGSQNSSGLFFYAPLAYANLARGLIGARFSGGNQDRSILIGSGGGHLAGQNVSAGADRHNVGGNNTGMALINRANSSDHSLFKDLTKFDKASVSSTVFAGNTFVFAVNSNGSVILAANSITGSAAGEFFSALSDAEINILNNALNALQTARASL